MIASGLVKDVVIAAFDVARPVWASWEGGLAACKTLARSSALLLGTQLGCTHSIYAFSGCISVRIELCDPGLTRGASHAAVPLCNTLLRQSTQRCESYAFPCS